MNVAMNIVCGNTQIRVKVKSHNRQHLNDLLHLNNVDYTNRPGNVIDVYVDDALNGHLLSQITRWLLRAIA